MGAHTRVVTGIISVSDIRGPQAALEEARKPSPRPRAPHFAFAPGLPWSFSAGHFITNEMDEDEEETYTIKKEKGRLELLGGWVQPGGKRLKV